MHPGLTRATVRYGLSFGIITGGVSLILGVASEYGLSHHIVDGGMRLTLSVLVLGLGALLTEAGHFAARQTGRIGIGALAGGIAGFCGAVPFSLTIVIATRLRNPAAYANVIGWIAGALLGLFLIGSCLFGLGLGLGALGALIGRAQFRRAHRQFN